MLDEMMDLRHAVGAYRLAVEAAGVAWPDSAQSDSVGFPDLLYRVFDVDHIADQVGWLKSQGLEGYPVLPEGGGLLPWPSDLGDLFDYLSFAIGTPFPWRHQLPLFHFETIVYTFVLAGDHEGEIWRYEFDPDAWDSVRAATSMAALFTEWTKGITEGVVTPVDHDWLRVGGDANDPFQALLEHTRALDPFAFPVSISDDQLLRERQRQCGADLGCINRGADCQMELLDVIAATRASLAT